MQYLGKVADLEKVIHNLDNQIRLQVKGNDVRDAKVSDNKKCIHDVEKSIEDQKKAIMRLENMLGQR